MPPTENSAALFGWHSQDSRATGPLDTADFTDGDDGCCYWQQKEPATQSPADTEGIE